MALLASAVARAAGPDDAAGPAFRRLSASNELSNEYLVFIVYLQKSASIEPRTSLSNFGGDSIHFSIHFLVSARCLGCPIAVSGVTQNFDAMLKQMAEMHKFIEAEETQKRTLEVLSVWLLTGQSVENNHVDSISDSCLIRSN